MLQASTKHCRSAACLTSYLFRNVFVILGISSTKYTHETLQKALKEIKDGTLSVYKASKAYRIPSQTLYDKIRDKYKKQNRTGAPTALTPAEESLIVEWVIMMAHIGFPVTKDILLHSVHKLVTEHSRANTFKQSYPGRHWYEGFRKRNPSITKLVSRPLSMTRIDATEDNIRVWFRQVQHYFGGSDHGGVIKDASRIFNCDESAFFLCPKGQAVLARTGSKSVYSRSGNDDKECITLLLGASADGKLMPTLALLPCKTIPADISAKYPKSWSIGRGENGWMTSENFYEYIANVFNPFLLKEKIQKPVVLFLDGHVSYLSFQVFKLCSENGIILMALLPSSAHVLQPLDVAIFDSLKNTLGENVLSWQAENNGRPLKREDFGPIVEKSINETLKPDVIKSGFRKCGLYPFSENGVDYSQLETTPVASSKLSTPKLTTQDRDYFVDIQKLYAFEQCSSE